tara:strand:+ start:325 stop:765 length:441 start_codon:yes stop_codon:yes gene_type:complete
MKTQQSPSFGLNFDDLESGDLVGWWWLVRDRIDREKGTMGRIEMELTRRMEADGATVLPDNTYDVELVSKYDYDRSKLAGIREFVPEADLIESGAYTPEHEKSISVPESWDMRHVKPLAKRGNDVRDIIDGSRIQVSRKLVIKEKK